jgi:hypothetical protein
VKKTPNNTHSSGAISLHPLLTPAPVLLAALRVKPADLKAMEKKERNANGREEAMSARGWTLSILAVPVLYVLSVPVVFGLGYRATNNTALPDGFRTYAAPYYLIRDDTPWEDWLDAYFFWVLRAMGVRVA